MIASFTVGAWNLTSIWGLEGKGKLGIFKVLSGRVSYDQASIFSV
nr:MAG TPA: molybdenum transporter-binding cassette domain protein [Caudoviricetes sp.]